MAMAQAQQKGAYDAIMLNFHGQVTEATTSNIWMIKNKVVKTPPIASGLLGGITRKALLEILAEQNYSFEEINFTVAELKSADEIFLSSSTKELVPVTKVDDTAIGGGKPGEITKQLHQYYLEKVRNS
jgi:branched-chain amino acid aminotransferase